MEMKKQNYNDNVLFILGAGASQPDGVPLQREILPKILGPENTIIRQSQIGKPVIDFLNENFHYSLDENNLPPLEAVFGFIDYFIQQNETLNYNYPTEIIRDIKESLIKLIYHVVNQNTDKESIYYKRFWNNLFQMNKPFSIVTLNYDTLLEQTLLENYKGKVLIDYCFHLMNYDVSPELENFNYWINPKHNMDENIEIVKIIKLHGSLNWKYCNCCNQTLLTPWDRVIDLNKGKFLGYTYPDNEEYEYFCPLDETEFQTVMLPPSYVKFLKHPVISTLINEAGRAIRKAKKIVFVGYSMSDADVHVKAILKKSITTQKLYVVNQKTTDGLKSHYYSLSENVEFIKTTFEDFVDSPEKLNEIMGD